MKFPRLAHCDAGKMSLLSQMEFISSEQNATTKRTTGLSAETYTSVASFCAVYGSHRSIHQLAPLKAAVASSAPSGEKSQEDCRYRVFLVPPVRLRMKVYERRLQRQTI